MIEFLMPKISISDFFISFFSKFNNLKISEPIPKSSCPFSTINSFLFFLEIL